MEREILPENEEFGHDEAWCLINRRVIDGNKTMIRALPVRGRGILLQTSRVDADGALTVDTPFMVDRAMIMQSILLKESELKDEKNQPLKIQYQCIAREVVDVETVRKMYGFHKRKPGDKTTPQPGAPDPSQIVPGAMLTMEHRQVVAPPQQAEA